jgi:hypothetical protein
MERNTFSATIVQLPENTTADQLVHIITATKAKTCYIPKHDQHKYKRMAILNFRNKEDLANAITQHIQINDCPLQWINKVVRTCHFCSSPNHQTDYCSDNTNPIVDTKGKYTLNPNRYKPLHQRAPNPYLNQTRKKSYADAIRGHHDIQPSITQDTIRDIRDALAEMINEIRNIKLRVTKVENRLDILENTIFPAQYEESKESNNMDEDNESISSRVTVSDEVERSNIKQQQVEINDQLKKMEDLMSATLMAVEAISPNNSKSSLRQASPLPAPH